MYTGKATPEIPQYTLKMLKDQLVQKWHCKLQICQRVIFMMNLNDSIYSMKTRQVICNIRVGNTRIPKVTGGGIGWQPEGLLTV